MRFGPREDRSGGSFEAHAGGYGEGDGETWMISGHTGLPLGETGFLNFSAEYGNARPTSRSVQRDDAALLAASGNTHIKNPDQISGRSRVEDDVKVWSHFGYPVRRSAMLYGHANYAAKSVTGGFTPQFGGDLVDGSIVAGLRGYTDSGFTWDVSGSYGMNVVDFFIRNTVNVSLGAATPAEFDPGLYSQRDINLNLDMTWPVNDMMHLAGDAEWRDERFEIGLGQVESYQIGPYAAQGFSAASNGFPGFGDIAAGAWNRSNVAVYGDAGMEGGEERQWGLDGGVRFENFSDFGGTLNGKLSGRYELAHALALRAGLSTASSSA